MSADQDDIDGMLASFDSALNESGDASQDLEGNPEGSPSGEDTATSALGQQEGLDNPEPWVHYVPEVEFKHADDLPTRLNEYFDLIEQTMTEKEFKLYDYVLKLGNIRYYDDFLYEVNDSFRSLVKLKKRKIKGQTVIGLKRDISERYLPGFEPAEDEDFQVVPDTMGGFDGDEGDEGDQEGDFESQETVSEESTEAPMEEAAQEVSSESGAEDGISEESEAQSQDDIDALLESS